MAKEIVSEVVDHVDHLPRFVDETSREGRWNLNRRRIAWVLVLSSLLWWLWPCGLLRTRPRLSSEFPAVAPVDDVPDIGFPESVLRTWAQYAPYIPVAEYIPPPPGCAISQVSAHPYNSRGVCLTHSALGKRGMWDSPSSDENLPQTNDSCNDMVHDIPPPTLAQI
jgi:hypothetical protein